MRVLLEGLFERREAGVDAIYGYGSRGSYVAIEQPRESIE